MSHFVTFIVWSAVVVSGWVVAAWGRKSYLEMVEMSSITYLVHFKDGGRVKGSAKLVLAKSRSVRGASHQPVFLIDEFMFMFCTPHPMVGLVAVP